MGKILLNIGTRGFGLVAVILALSAILALAPEELLPTFRTSSCNTRGFPTSG
ncbi:hypothetical protein KBT16_26745 [Nostoc sp. CCCryo 231-06]|nr:hypothetical protein [Nostoc sp. CCCryo 231-06]